ncbi:M4 family metallopeptidase [uncultured Aquimarina sp.]|uniref:M4 family metallopeptidase n=1 Tax=uncultured Aquimarina sp. TaxID=575652 RepID=UPI00260C261F|nr:M4 family metallopeptidase [uncultured Aquimarina sp.]
MTKFLRFYFMLFTVLAIGQQSKIVKIPLTEIPSTQKTGSITSILSNSVQSTTLSKSIRSTALTEFRLIGTKTDRKGFVHRTYQQYHNGIKVVHGVIKIHEKNGLKESFNGVYFDAEGVKTTINISTTQIENIAKKYIGSNDVFWIGDNDFSKTVVPEPELLILPNRKDDTMRLAYAIGIGTSTPELKMGRVYIDAQTGSVIKYTSLIRSCFDSNHADAPHNHTGNINVPLVSGLGETVYSGSKTIETTLDTDYVLYDQTRASTGQGHNHGSGTRNGIVTVNFNNHDVLNDYNSAFVTDFTDNDNNWTAGEMSANEDQYALDAHWGAQVVYDYWKNEHGRDSYDGNDASIVSYVHFDTDYTNAAWISFNNQRGFMVYGDGAGSFTPLTNLDVVSHEIGHGITNANSNLDYELESGALNEGMSDIWAAAIDMYATTNHGTTKSPWLINDENGGGTFRSMSNPNAYGQPDTYGGTYWYDVVGCTPDGTNNDYCGVHTNSGVLNYWFYLITEGGSGTNDNADSYSVSAIGIDKSAAIAYRMESVYLTSTSDYEDARAAAIQAAKDLYGNCSNEEEAVTNAWYAAGVGAQYTGQNPSIIVDTSDQTVCVDEIATFTAEADYANTMIWQNDASGSWVDLSDDTTYAGVATNTLTITNPTEALDGVRFRLKFFNDCGTTTTTNNRYLYVKTLPDVTSVVPNGAGCTSATDGSLTVNFNEVSNLSNLEFSIDGGATYPYNYADTSGSQTISDLDAGDYNVWVRRGGDECPREVGTYTVTSIPTVTATVDAIIEADIAEINGIIQVSFPDEPTQTQIKFSIDGGISYGYVFNDNTGTAELTDLAADTYEVWATYGDELCAKRIGNFTVNEMAYTQIPDANFEAALYNLGYDNYLGDDKVPTSLINTVTSLNIRLENITDLTGIEDFTALEELYADNNGLTTVDVSSNTALKELIVYNNANLSSFTIADPSIITRITLSGCNLSGEYDFSTYTSLTNFSVQSNDLTGLNIKNGNNTNFTYFHAGGNSNLSCIKVDDVAWSTANWTNNGGATFTTNYCNYTAIPDANFEAALEALGYDDISSDGQVPTSLIEVVANLDVSNQSIADVTGIEDFTDLIDLNVNDNGLTNLDVSNNGNLQILNFDNNDVVNLVLGTNTILSEVSGRYNQLTTVDVSANTGLTNLNLRNNTFSTVDVATNTNLRTLNLNETGITSLDVTNNPDLAYLYLSGNSLTSIDFLQNPLLENVNLTDSNLINIDLSNQTVLRIIRLSGNNLTELDLTTNVALTQVECADNELSSFNFKNGFNQIITDFDASGNANLSCVLVDDLNKDYTFWIKDATTSFSDTYCRYTAIPDANFEAALETLGYDDISADGQVPTVLIEVVTDLNVDSEGILDITGIEDFKALTSLSCFNNALTTIDLSNNLNLESLMLKENSLATVNVLNNTELVSLRISDNNLTTLDVSNNVNLSTLRCDTNNIAILDVSNNTQLVHLDVYNMATLTSLDIDSNTNLQAFKANNTGITTIDFSNNPLLRLVYLHQTPIANVDFSQNPLIEELRVQNTQITALDVSLQTALTNLNCSQNSLSYLNVKNGNNTAITDFDASSNPNLSCILVDDLANDYSTWTKDAATSFNDTYCRYTAIPDANFEAALSSYDDISNDGLVPTAAIENVANLNVTLQSISDLTGIQDFTALKKLSCEFNNLTSIDVSNNLLLEELYVSLNNLTSLDVSNNTALKKLGANTTNITNLDLTNNSALEELNIFSNSNLTSLDVSNNPLLNRLIASSTSITSLDVSSNPLLTELQVHDTGLESIDLTNNTAILQLRINQTPIENLDVSTLTNLRVLNCSETNLYNLNIQNGNNTLISEFNASSNPNLSCILVDDAAYSAGNTIWANNVDTGVTFNEGTYCRYTAISDANFEAELEALGYDDISGDGQVPTQLIEGLETLDVENKSISDLTGIEDFRAIKTLDVGYNSLTTIDVTNITELRQLIVRSNNLTTIDLSANTLLVGFKAENCSLTSLDITNNPDLKVLWLSGNDLTAIDLSNNIALTSFWGSGNDFVTLDLTNNPALNSFRASSNSLTSLNLKNGTNTNITGGTNFQLTGNADLACVLVDDAAYSTTTWLGIDGNVNFSDTDCDYTLIPDANFEAALRVLGYDDSAANDGRVPTRFIEVVTNLNVPNLSIADLTGIEDFVALTNLNCSSNSLTSLNVSSNTALESLNFSRNTIASIDVSNNVALKQIFAFENNLTTIDVSQNTDLEDLDIDTNFLTTLDLSANTVLETLDVLNNSLVGIDVSNNLQLWAVYLSYNTIANLDLSNHALLEDLECVDCELTYLNVKNGNNTNITTFRVNNNPDLSCILVDAAAWSTTSWTNIDITTSFSDTYCRYTQIPDANFEAELEALGYDDISGDGQVPTALIEVVTSLDVRSKSISDVTGIADFTALEVFNCNLNNIAALDVSNNVNLIGLQCTANPITTLNLANNTQLAELNCRSTNITSLDLTNNTLLKRLICFDTDIVSIDLSQNLLLEQLYCYNNTSLTSLDLSNNTALKLVQVQNSELVSLNVKNGNNADITNFNASGNPNLSCILVDDLANDYSTWTKDITTNFSDIYCRYTTIPDANFEIALEALGYDDINGDGQVPTALIETITSISVNGKSISDLTGIEGFVAVENLYVGNNLLTSLDFSANLNLKILDVADNANLTTINVTNNTALEEVFASNCGFTTVDFSNNTALQILTIFDNNLTALDLSANVNLESVLCQNNNIEGLDLSSNAALTYIDVSNNALTTLNSKNGNNINVTVFNALNNSELSCVLVDDAAYSTANWTGIDGTATFSDTFCRYTYVPDDNFELSLGTYDDIPGDNYVPTVNIEVVTNLTIYAGSAPIADVTGIEDFVALERLEMEDHTFTTADLSSNINLIGIDFKDTPLTDLTISANTNLESIQLDNTSLTSLDLSNNNALSSLRIHNMPALTAPDLTNNTNLTSLDFYDIDLSAGYDISHLVNLEYLAFYDTSLNAIDLSGNTLLFSLQLSNNNITDLDISHLTGSLGDIGLYGTLITELDLSSHTNLEFIMLDNLPNLSSLNLKNGTNTDVIFFRVLNTPSLSCILVDDAAWSTTNWNDIDATASFSNTYCRYTYVPDDNFESFLVSFDDNPGDNYIPTARIEGITGLSILGSSGIVIADLTGIEDFTALRSLSMKDHTFTTVDLSSNVNLKTIDFENIPLADLTISANINLESIQLDNTAITSLDVSNNLLLEELYCTNTGLAGLDLSLNTALKVVEVQNNDLVSLNIKNGNNTNITSFNASGNSSLSCILVDDLANDYSTWTKDATASFNETSCDYVVVDIDVFLQGAMLDPIAGEENLMRDDLRTNGYIDSDTPYTDGASINETVGISDNGNNSTVDWIWVELRDATDPTLVIAGQSGILQRDGDIVDVADDLVTPLTFDVPTGDYYVVIKHRNHLGIMTAAAISLSPTRTTIDFTDATNQITYGGNAQTTYGMPSDILAMWSGDTNGDGKINLIGSSNDANTIRDTILNDPINQAIQFYGFNVTGYNDADVNLTGGTQIIGNNNDANLVRDNILNHPINSFIQFYGFTITEQLPEEVSTKRIALDTMMLEKMKVLAAQNN